MVTIKIEREGESVLSKLVTPCPFLKDSGIMAGSTGCSECEFHVNETRKMLWCIGDEHPISKSEE